MQQVPDWAEPQVREYQSHNNGNGPFDQCQTNADCPTGEYCYAPGDSGKKCYKNEGGPGTPVPIDGTVFQAALIIAGLIVGAFMLSKNDHDPRRSRSKNGCPC